MTRSPRGSGFSHAQKKAAEKAVKQIAVAKSYRIPQFGVHTDACKAGEGVYLVENDVLANEEIHS